MNKSMLKALNNKNWFKIQSSDQDSHLSEVFIYDTIGYWGVTAIDFVSELKKITSEKIIVHVNSPGGDVFDGMAIYNALKQHKSNIEVHVDGLAASMGSVIALAGDTVKMHENAFFMIHNPWSLAIGDAREFRKSADLLDKIGSTMVSIYAARTDKDPNEIQEMMDDDTWLNAEEAKDFGFASEIIGDKTSEKVALSENAYAAVKAFKNTPDAFVAMLGDDQKESEIDDLSLMKDRFSMRLRASRAIEGVT